MNQASGGLDNAGEVLNQAGDKLGQLGSENNTPEWIADGWDTDSQGRFFNPYDEEWYTQDQLMAGSEPTYMDQDDFSEADAKMLTDGIKNSVSDSDDNKTEEIAESPREFMKTLREGSEAKDENMTDEEVAKAVGSNSVASMLKEAGFSGEQIASYLGTEAQSPGNINASTVTINASSVNMEKGDNIKLAASVEDTNENRDSNSTQNDKVEIANGETITLDSGETEESTSQSTKREKFEKFAETFAMKGGLEQIGTLFNDMIEGAHDVAKGLYVDGMAPTQEWADGSKTRMAYIEQGSKKRKEYVERAKDNWAHDKANITIMSNKYYNEKYLPEMKEKYGQKLKNGEIDMKYVESKAREKADEKAKAAMKDMSAYVEYGVTDVNLAYKLYENANNNGLSPEQSVKDYAPYHQFNNNAANINSINVSGLYKENNYKEVEKAIPNAKTYYDAGYTNVNEMAWVDYMAEKLGKSPEFAMKVDETLKKKGKGGKLSYNGKDADMKKVIDQINSHYD